MEKNLVLLVGPQGSGKTTYCKVYFPQFLRISQDEQGRQGHQAAFENAIQTGAPVVIDRINGLKGQRRRYLDYARTHGYRTRIIWLNVDRNECLKRCRVRTDHPTLRPEDADKAIQIYFNSFQIPSRKEADELTIIGPPPVFVPVADISAEIGQRRHLIIGDIHGCFDELCLILGQLQFQPQEDVLVSVGDIIDRGPKTRETLELLFSLPRFFMVQGNHENKLVRYVRMKRGTPTGGMAATLAAYNDQIPDEIIDRLDSLPLILKTPSGYVVHAGFDPEMSAEEQNQSDCIYMRNYGGKTYFDEINGRPWFTLWPPEAPRVFFGHDPREDGPSTGNVISLDQGCVFGGALRVWDSRDGQVHKVPARQTYAESHHAPASVISSTPELTRTREEYVASGLLRSDYTEDGRLAIYTYTDQCVYSMAWDSITRNARGHIYDLKTGECAAHPFPKFFNLNENLDSQTARFPWHLPYEIYEKMDGWLGVLYRHEGAIKVASRGSFHSSGAVWASRFIQKFDLTCLPWDATLCFEIIHPEHQIILKYPEETLVILAAFNRLTQQEYPRSQVAKWAEEIGLPLVPLLESMSLEYLLDHQKTRENFEGFVIRFSDGQRVKVKTEWYSQMARIMSNLTPIALWEAMIQGKVRQEYLASVPEELRPLAEKYQTILEGQYAQVKDGIEKKAAPLIQEFGHDRKALAQQVQAKATDLVRRTVFLILDGKFTHVDKIIMQEIYPKGNQLKVTRD